MKLEQYRKAIGRLKGTKLGKMVILVQNWPKRAFYGERIIDIFGIILGYWKDLDGGGRGNN